MENKILGEDELVREAKIIVSPDGNGGNTFNISLTNLNSKQAMAVFIKAIEYLVLQENNNVERTIH